MYTYVCLYTNVIFSNGVIAYVFDTCCWMPYECYFIGWACNNSVVYTHVEIAALYIKI